MRVSRARISGSMLSRLGARWVTMTKAMPGSGGWALNRYSSASTPPAEAPTPTMGNGLSISSPSRRKRKVSLPALGGSRQGHAKPLRIQSAFAGLTMGLMDGSVGDASLCEPHVAGLRGRPCLVEGSPRMAPGALATAGPALLSGHEPPWATAGPALLSGHEPPWALGCATKVSAFDRSYREPIRSLRAVAKSRDGWSRSTPTSWSCDRDARSP